MRNMFGYTKKYIRKGLFQTIFHVTYRCNGSCPYCFNLDRLNSLREDELSLQEIDRISRTMGDFPWLMLSGGEPLLREHLPEIVRIFSANNRIRHVTLPTNGLLPERAENVSKEILTRCPGVTLTLSVSIDGIGQRHDELRGTSGNFAAALETISRTGKLRSISPRLALKVNTVLSSRNCFDISDIIGYVRTLGVDMHTMDIIRNVPNRTTPPLPEEVLSGLPLIMKEICDHYYGYHNLNTHSSLFRRLARSAMLRSWEISLENLGRNTRYMDCYAGKVNTVLYPSGEVAPCEVLPAIGNLRDFDYDFKALRSSRKAEDVRESIRDRRCHCYHPCYTLTNILFNPRELLKLIR